MAGFFGLFGGKTKYVDEPSEPIQPQNKEAYYLQPDDAKTYGNIDFMRKPNTIKRSFPNTIKGKGAKLIKSVSSMEVMKVNNNELIAPKSVAKDSSTASNNSSKRRASSDMDNFLKMAREIKK
ncbi:MAG: hypothetical protein N5P05_003269 [Chroococcopsis gigantea SAG 12.99]|jgi:hypothetical protein|nr:hypothetical protein [Chlorogloea purpurea SAG 13.99]MDV3001663.1 hypothetical protein [Chroococcopsis gigantea SAG 12.99]